MVPVTFVVLIVVELLGAFLAPGDPSQIALDQRYIVPFTQWAHVLGTDQLGRDILTRVLAGASISLSVTALSIVIASVVGVTVGMVAGFFGGFVDSVAMRLADAMLSLPTIMVALFLVAVLDPGFWSVVTAIALVTWARYSRFVRSQVLSLRTREFIDAAIICGTPPGKILWRHFLPNVVNSIVVLLTLDIGRIILLESSLAFLGLGLPPDSGAWGASVFEGKAYLPFAPWIALTPAVAMMITIISANAFGNWLSDRLDPRLRAVNS
jgi:peptide/nickel transport system permease protein